MRLRSFDPHTLHRNGPSAATGPTCTQTGAQKLPHPYMLIHLPGPHSCGPSSSWPSCGNGAHAVLLSRGQAQWGLCVAAQADRILPLSTSGVAGASTHHKKKSGSALSNDATHNWIPGAHVAAALAPTPSAFTLPSEKTCGRLEVSLGCTTIVAILRMSCPAEHTAT